jgi:hypothetical protein
LNNIAVGLENVHFLYVVTHAPAAQSLQRSAFTIVTAKMQSTAASSSRTPGLVVCIVTPPAPFAIVQLYTPLSAKLQEL